jgi:hypothetical protein
MYRLPLSFRAIKRPKARIAGGSGCTGDFPGDRQGNFVERQWSRRKDVDQSAVENMSRDIARDFAVVAKHRTFVRRTPAGTELFIYTEEGGWAADGNGGDLLERVLRSFIDETLRQIKAKCEMLIERGEKQQADALSDLAIFFMGCQFRKDWRKTLGDCVFSTLTQE